MARKGGVPADRVLNAMTLPQILKHFKQRRRVLGENITTTGLDLKRLPLGCLLEQRRQLNSRVFEHRAF